jgi:hypothetical protein
MHYSAHVRPPLAAHCLLVGRGAFLVSRFRQFPARDQRRQISPLPVFTVLEEVRLAAAQSRSEHERGQARWEPVRVHLQSPEVAAAEAWRLWLLAVGSARWVHQGEQVALVRCSPKQSRASVLARLQSPMTPLCLQPTRLQSTQYSRQCR